ncbi:MAG TPA: response regulator [Candidatus Latescibacteria bacterium]|nr:response regulator [Candidatus Handelsmanbacteria bacterium]HIL10657.1 response regulator [Candidatus Latescibacterota bacterium]
MTQKPTWTILLIDPQPMSRNTLKSQLEYYQYIVLPTVDARSGLQTFQQNQRTVDLVILDLKLKDEPATKVLEILRKLSPELKIIAITDQSVTENQPAFAGLAGLLRKPIRTDRLLALVSKALGRI